MEKGEKVEAFNHEPYDQKKRIVPPPKMGKPIDNKYDDLVHNYFEKKEKKKLMAALDEEATHQTAAEMVKMNRKMYEKINKNSNFGTILSPSAIQNESETFSKIQGPFKKNLRELRRENENR